jgi:hypothetical protein
MTLFLPKINEGCQGQPRTKRLSSLTGGWKSSYYSPLPVEGEIFFLTFPFIEPAISLFLGLMGLDTDYTFRVNFVTLIGNSLLYRSV